MRDLERDLQYLQNHKNVAVIIGATTAFEIAEHAIQRALNAEEQIAKLKRTIEIMNEPSNLPYPDCL